MIAFGLDEYWAIEIKASRTFQCKKGFYVACEDLQVQRKFVVYAGEDTFLTSHATIALSLAHFMEELRKKTG